MNVQKVYPGLKEAKPGTPYHLGHFEVDFQDGPLRFQVIAQLCPEPHCDCDNLQIDWLANETRFQAWYTGQRQWTDMDHKPLADDLEAIFQNIEETKNFQERYSHLMFLRRKQVLETRQRTEEPFQILIPKTLLDDHYDPENEILGRLPLKDKKAIRNHSFDLQFCKEPNCYCDNIILVVDHEGQEMAFNIDSKNALQLMNNSSLAKKWVPTLATRLKNKNSFSRLVDHLRSERRLHNYARYVAQYQKEHASPANP